MVQATISDSALLEVLFDVFRKHGYEGTSIAQLSDATGLKKSSLYHRFPNGKADMAKAVVNYVLTQLASAVIAPLANSQLSPDKRLEDMLGTVTGFYCGGSKNCLLNVFSLGNAEDELAALLNVGYENWLAALTKLAIEFGLSPNLAKERAQHLLIMIEGSLVIQRVTNQGNFLAANLELEKSRFFS